jgi:hypothetical protein
VVDHEIDRDERFNLLGSGTASDGGVPHGGDINEKWDTSEILQNDACDGEWDFVFAGSLGVIICEVFHILGGHLAAIHTAEDRLQYDADRDRELGELWEPLFGEGGE